jgi:hypothetical protein
LKLLVGLLRNTQRPKTKVQFSTSCQRPYRRISDTDEANRGTISLAPLLRAYFLHYVRYPSIRPAGFYHNLPLVIYQRLLYDSLKLFQFSSSAGSRFICSHQSKYPRIFASIARRASTELLNLIIIGSIIHLLHWVDSIIPPAKHIHNIVRNISVIYHGL